MIRELLVNAVAHRDYNLTGARVIIKIFKDRIEYQSPGPLPEGITPENITKAEENNQIYSGKWKNNN